ncbi:MAG TPA: hypothetical protein VK590_06745, partial [Saprospiraceae bacterium]|nr:hypothetical protein [Saprospiraceae bacterium]
MEFKRIILILCINCSWLFAIRLIAQDGNVIDSLQAKLAIFNTTKLKLGKTTLSMYDTTAI